ncbi:C39 family peptidase [Streptomyces sp. PKU-MA01144]|uniref:C39 family peptidase n=1 Tax=Streptomyces sp. PKU-MA01144 TaxID=2729138 RepID=UPI00201826CC|nr:C39 family peptidase [Streptomyces sp. PKU-MA01144]
MSAVRTGRRLALMTAVCLLSVLTATGPATAGETAGARAAAGHDTDPFPGYLPGSDARRAPGAFYKQALDTLGPQRLTAEQRRITARKEAAASAGFRHPAVRARAGYLVSGGLHQSQQTSYWCGPAALVITQSAHDEVGGRSQRAAADLLKTDSTGTAWYGVGIDVPEPTGYPMADALNHRLPGANYVPRSLPYSPTAADVADFRKHIVHNTGYDYAIAGNAWEVPGGPHLAGHPNIEIFHWVAIDGYNSDTNAQQVRYLDPVGGVSTSMISWAGSVPKSARISADTITTIMGGRGYVW